jgi:hypothetical protein
MNIHSKKVPSILPEKRSLERFFQTNHAGLFGIFGEN